MGTARRSEVITAVFAASTADDPLTPDPDQARRLLQEELADPAYARAEPTPVDRIARAIADGVQRLFDGDGGGDLPLAIAAVVVLLAVVVVAFALWGRPRAAGRRAAAPEALFGRREVRDAAQLRRDAEAHADAGRWDDAIIDRMRALARALADRGLVEAPPGTTVHGFAARAGAVFPTHAERLEAAAAAFDDVRYLRRPGTAAGYASLRALDDELATLSPAVTRS